MNLQKIFLSFFLLVFLSTVANASDNNITFSITDNAVIKSVDTSVSFFIPNECKEVYLYICDSHKNVFQKIKIHQRGNGKIVIDRKNLNPGVYFYSMCVDGEIVDTQKLTIK